MKADRLRALERGDVEAKLTPDEMKEGWHWCQEFDFLLTQGELFDDKEELVCICGFDRRKVDEYLAKKDET